MFNPKKNKFKKCHKARVVRRVNKNLSYSIIKGGVVGLKTTAFGFITPKQFQGSVFRQLPVATGRRPSGDRKGFLPILPPEGFRQRHPPPSNLPVYPPPSGQIFRSRKKPPGYSDAKSQWPIK